MTDIPTQDMTLASAKINPLGSEMKSGEKQDTHSSIGGDYVLEKSHIEPLKEVESSDAPKTTLQTVVDTAQQGVAQVKRVVDSAVNTAYNAVGGTSE